MADKTKEEKRIEDMARLKDKKEFKYKKIVDLQMDLNTRLKIALQDGQDPLGLLSITQIVEDIETVNRLKGLNIEE